MSSLSDTPAMRENFRHSIVPHKFKHMHASSNRHKFDMLKWMEHWQSMKVPSTKYSASKV